MTIREDRWHGGASQIPAPFAAGDVYVLHGSTRHGRSVLPWKVFSLHVVAGIPATPAIVVLPDARELPLGGPLFVFFCTGDGGEAVQFQSSDGSTVVTPGLPNSVAWYLIDNSTQGGLWAFDIEGFIINTPPPRPHIVSFGAENITGSVDEYSYDSDAWQTNIDTTEDLWRGGASTGAGFSLIRHDETVWSWTNPTLSVRTLAGFAKAHAVAFTGQFDGSNDHWCFGAPDPIASSADIFNDVGNTISSIIFPPLGLGYIECTGSAARSGPNDLLILCFGARSTGAGIFEAYLTNPQFHFAIQNTPYAHNYRAPMVTLRNFVHIFGGASFDSDNANVGTQWHEKYQSSELTGWSKQPLLSIPLRGQGVSLVPRTQNRAVLAMGRDHSAIPSYNQLGFEYNDLTESYSARANKVWTSGTQEQENSWAPASF